MRIISNFSDYYDGVMAGDKGPPVYKRAAREVHLDRPVRWPLRWPLRSASKPGTVRHGPLDGLLRFYASMPRPGAVYSRLWSQGADRWFTGRRVLVVFCGEVYAFWRREPWGG